MEYNVKIESEPIGDKESLYLSVTHNGGSAWTSIRIVNPDVEIPQIIDVLQRYPNQAMHSDGEGRCPECETRRKQESDENYRKLMGIS